ncbi:hypothetical protein CEXT_491241 [Caerostris extrusa]|uniref:Reverse transcriptase n=1 Tax=Caerostris extrusa TaxID=172846 RepID=A0AAV4UG46_CAEEX|nr:hypothetical protein CEXT_491241 [Caerostris extrusa]
MLLHSISVGSIANTLTLKIHSSAVKQETTLLQSEFEPCTELVFDAPITRDELACALRSLNSGKSPGIDGIHSEFLSHLGSNAFENVWTFFNLIRNTGIVPAEWRTSIIIPIHKKSKDPNMLQNYRHISLTSIAGKAMEKIVVRRLN